ncbi:response regulator [Aurantibacter sp.]|uniref:response regulator n=1 Tax=Aurantibacter sp. TaxID=2807103 RepID=UPI003267BE54
MNTTNPLIFLVDDDQDDQQLFSEALEATKLESSILTFNNGVDLMANLHNPTTELPDLIFLDLNMPLMNGVECLDDIKREPRFSDIHVVIYSGYFDEAEVKLLQSKGAAFYLQKPQSFKELIFKIENCFSSLKNEATNIEDFVIE